MPDPSRIKEVFLPILLVLAVFAVGLVFPPLSVVMGIVSPAPLIFVYLQRGRQVGLVAAGALFLMILALMGIKAAAVFFAEYAVLAAIMAETIRLRFTMQKSVLFSALGSAALSGVLLFLFFAGKEATLTDLFQQQVREQAESSLETLKGMGKDKAELDSMRGVVEKASRLLAVSYPAFIVLGSLICAAANYTLVRFVWLRMYGEAPMFAEKFSGLVLPDQLVWPFILSAASFFLPGDELFALGLNVFVVMLAIYFLQGLAIVVHVLETKTVPVFLWILALVLIFTQPVIMGVVIGLGLFDMWADFRKARVAAGPDDETHEEE